MLMSFITDAPPASDLACSSPREKSVTFTSAIPTFRLPDGTCIAPAQPPRHPAVTLVSAALSVMTDLTQMRAATIRPDASLTQAENQMIHHGVRMLFVAARMSCVEGLVTASTLQGDKPMQLIHLRNVRHDDLCVADIMTKLCDVDVVDLETLRHSTVGDVASTLRRFGHSHLLVVESESRRNFARIRGVISHTQLERQLGTALPMVEVACTFAELARALA